MAAQSIARKFDARVARLFCRARFAGAKRVIECPSFVIAHGLLRGSDAIAALPAPLLDHPWVGDGLAVLPITDLPPPIAIGVATRRDSPLTPAASLLVECLQDVVSSRRALSSRDAAPSPARRLSRD
jgi:DNA-binding transcriptional LysR family regulator